MEKNTWLGNVFIWLSRTKIVPSPVKRLFFALWGCHIGAVLPKSVIFPHPFGIVIHSKTVLGENVIIMHQVTLGQKRIEDNTAPIVEDGVFIGAGAKILGNVKVGRLAVIGANAIVTKDVPPGAVIVGANRIVKQRSLASKEKENSEG